MIYLASPYSDPDPEVVELRYRLVRDLAMRLLLREETFVFSPIMYCHRAAMEIPDTPTDALAWIKMNTYFQRQSTELWLLTLEGWKESKGVEEELKFAKLIRQNIRYVTASGLLWQPTAEELPEWL